MTVRLRILSGVHKGAELDLTPGDWSVGSDALCDILLSDTAQQQATLRVDEDGSVYLLPQQESSLLNGQQVPPEGLPLPHFVCVQWGAVYAAAGPTNADWPPVALPSENAEAQTAKKEATAEMPLTLTPKEQAQGFESHGGILGYAGYKGFGLWFSPARLVLLLLLLALTVGGAWQWKGTPSSQQQRENIEAVLRAEGLKPSAFDVEESMGAWTVRGVVTDNKKLQDVSAALRGLGLVLQTDVLSQQSVVEALEARIQAEGARLNITQRGDTLRLTGYAFDAKSLQTLLQPLEADCQRAQVRQDVVFWQELRQPLKDSLNALKLQESVRMTPGPYTIAMDTTALSATQKESLRTLEREVMDMTRGISPLTRPVSTTVAGASHRPQPAALKALLCEQLRISLPTGGQGAALVVIFEGREYAPGAHLPSGMQVQEVRPEYVTLVQGDRLVYCPGR